MFGTIFTGIQLLDFDHSSKFVVKCYHDSYQWDCSLFAIVQITAQDLFYTIFLLIWISSIGVKTAKNVARAYIIITM